MQKFNIVFMGTPEFSIPTLEYLIKNHNVLAVYTKEPKPQGRKMVLTKSPIHIMAEQHNIPVFTPKNFKNIEDVEKLKSFNPDFIIVIAYGLILPKSVLDIPSIDCINIHASILPKYRGANPIQRAVLMGEKKTGITIMKMDIGMDTGDMLYKKEIDIDDNITYGQLEQKMSFLSVEALDYYFNNMNTLSPIKQGDDFSLALKLQKDEMLIDFSNEPFQIYNLIRALMPYPKAFFTHNNNIIKVLEAKIIDENTSFNNGTIISKDFKIACGNGKVIQFIKLQKAGGNSMELKDFLNGYKIEIGQVLNKNG